MEEKSIKIIEEKIVALYEIWNSELRDNQKIDSIQYIEDMELIPERFQTTTFVVKGTEEIMNEQGEKENRDWIELYDENNIKIGKINKFGELEFQKDYIEILKERFGEYFSKLGIQEDTRIPFKEIMEKNQTKQQHRMTEKKIKQYLKKSKEVLQGEQDDKENVVKEIMEKRGIPQNRYLTVREDSNFYKDHPELTKEGLTFYEDKDGIIKVGYINENGEWEDSQFIEPSRTQTYTIVDIGKDGSQVEEIVPYQVMDTKGLNTDGDVRDVKIIVTIEQGYLSVKEARQGQNGKWSAHEIEVQGRDYNEHEINEVTSMETGEADPDKHTDAYEKLENTNIEEDGIQYNEMELVEHADEIIKKFQKQGYSKEEAIDIFNYMIGEEKLTENQAKERVEKERTQEKQEEQEEERTPWGDAERRERRY